MFKYLSEFLLTSVESKSLNPFPIPSKLSRNIYTVRLIHNGDFRTDDVGRSKTSTGKIQQQPVGPDLRQYFKTRNHRVVGGIRVVGDIHLTGIHSFV